MNRTGSQYLTGLELETPDDLSHVALADLPGDEKDRVERTIRVAGEALLADNSEGGSLEASTDFPEDVAERVEDAVSPCFPNFFRESILTGLQAEEMYQNRLAAYAAEAGKMQDVLEELIHLSSQLSIANPDQETLPITEEIQEACRQLKEAGIELGIGAAGQTITRERAAELKTTIGSHMDHIKSKLQTLFTTKIQVAIHEMNAILECLKTFQKYADRLFGTLVQNQKAH